MAVLVILPFGVAEYPCNPNPVKMTELTANNNVLRLIFILISLLCLYYLTKFNHLHQLHSSSLCEMETCTHNLEVLNFCYQLQNDLLSVQVTLR